jgi:hypothetical protein
VIATAGFSLPHNPGRLFPTSPERAAPFSRSEGTYLAVDTCRMAKKSEPQKPISWKVYKIASKAAWPGEVEAPNAAIASETAAAEGAG